MSYRLPEERSDVFPRRHDPHSRAADFSRHSYLAVDNGTISRISIPCVYGRPFTRYDKLAFDHFGWPSPGHRDRSNYGKILAIHQIDLPAEGYDEVIVVMPDAPSGLTVTGEINYDVINLTITAICPAAAKQDVDVDFAIYVTGNTSGHTVWDEEITPLRDLVTKGTLRIYAGLI